LTILNKGSGLVFGLEEMSWVVREDEVKKRRKKRERLSNEDI
jgi:hypothetical protein